MVSPTTAVIVVTARRRAAESEVNLESTPPKAAQLEEAKADGHEWAVDQNQHRSHVHHHRLRSGGRWAWRWRIMAAVLSAVCLASVLLAASRLNATGGEEDDDDGEGGDGWFPIGNGKSRINSAAHDANSGVVAKEPSVTQTKGGLTPATAEVRLT